MFEQGNSHEHQLQLGESSNWLQMGVLFEREYKKLIVIHRAIFSEVEPENDEYEIVSRVQKNFEIKFSKQTNSKREISFVSVKFSMKEFNRLIEN